MSTPAKRKSATKKVASHPTYISMIKKGIVALKERNGSSRQHLLAYIMANFKVGTDARAVNNHLKMALRRGVKTNALKQTKGTGASGSFKVAEKVKSTPKKAVKAKKPKKVSTGAAKPKKSPKKKKTPKKTTAKKSPKKVKKATKPKKTKTPKKSTKKSPKKTKA